MSEKINIDEATERLSQLVDLVEAGEEIIIARGGQPVARLVPCPAPGVERKPGRMRGRIRIGRDFDEPLPGEAIVRRLKGTSSVGMTTDETLALTRK